MPRVQMSEQIVGEHPRCCGPGQGHKHPSLLSQDLGAKRPDGMCVRPNKTTLHLCRHWLWHQWPANERHQRHIPDQTPGPLQICQDWYHHAVQTAAPSNQGPRSKWVKQMLLWLKKATPNGQCGQRLVSNKRGDTIPDQTKGHTKTNLLIEIHDTTRGWVV